MNFTFLCSEHLQQRFQVKPRIMRIMRFTRIMNFNISAGEMLRHSKDYEVYKEYEL